MDRSTKLPETIEGEALYTWELTQTPQSRKRQKKIVGHLPLSTPYRLCEIRLDSLVSPETLAAFASEFQHREMQRKKQREEEERMEAQAKSCETLSSRDYFLAGFGLSNSAFCS